MCIVTTHHTRIVRETKTDKRAFCPCLCLSENVRLVGCHLRCKCVSPSLLLSASHRSKLSLSLSLSLFRARARSLSLARALSLSLCLCLRVCTLVSVFFSVSV